MKSWRAWVSDQTVEVDGVVNSQELGEFGLLIRRQSRPNTLAICPPMGNIHLEVGWVEQAFGELPSAQFLTLGKNATARGAYERALELGLSIGTFHDLAYALETCDDLSSYRPRLPNYVRDRLERTGAVKHVEWRRKLHFEISRRGLSTLNAAFDEPYEVSADWIEREVMAAEVELDAVVTTNPNCRGISAPTCEFARDLGVRVMTFNPFLRSLGQSWI